MSGKDFSCKKTNESKLYDFYETPYSMTNQLIEIIKPELENKTILDPCCGKGAISKILEKDFLTVAYDKHYGERKDFFYEYRAYDILLTNPPYSIVDKFFNHAKEIIQEKIILLMRVNALLSTKRYQNIFSSKEWPLTRIYPFVRMPMLGYELRDDGKYHTGMQGYAWYIFEKNPENFNGTILQHIDNQKYVLKKSDGCQCGFCTKED